MCSMCHYCGAQLPKSEDERKKLEIENSLKLNGEGHGLSCRFCQEKQEQEYVKRNGWSPTSPMISPTASLSSSDRSVSSCSDISVDVNSYDQGCHEEGAVDKSLEEKKSSCRLNGQLHTSSSEAPSDGAHSLHKVIEESHHGNDSDIVRDIEIVGTVNRQETKDNTPQSPVESINGGDENFRSVDNETDAQVWEPPEADPEDDFDGSMALIDDDDDDDECGDSTTWAKPSSLSSYRDEASGSYRFKEEKQKAMEEVVNGKFKAIVSQLLTSVGVPSLGKECDCWVDIISSLSWEAASYLKPDAIDSKRMDPDGYVKVKCIETGSRSDSQVVKGLVFKKHAAHKHMPTSYKNPRLLLIRGVLGESSSGLSSFKSMELEKENLKSLMDMIDMCHPNVVLVEKSVARDVQESILAKGMTLVYDMKLHRLERVARCTGSQILSSDTLVGQKLKQCEYFHIEKFVEEHAGLGEAGKKPSKTLMFIEGCSTRLGCTILLKGSHSDELKKVKCVVQIAVIMAYNLILETLFLVDWKAMFSTFPLSGAVNLLATDHPSSVLGTADSTVTTVEESNIEPWRSPVHIPISDVCDEEGSHNLNTGLESNSMSYVPYDPVIFSGFSSLSTSLKKVIGDNFALSSSAPYHTLANYFGFNGKETHGQIADEIPVLKTLEASDHCEMKSKDSVNEEKLLTEYKTQSLRFDSEPVGKEQEVLSEDQVQAKNDVNAVLESQSILVLMSSRNALRGTICEHSHFSHIMFYRNFDIPLGKFLQDNLLNQRRQCATCGELPEAHFYFYAHHNKQLTIRVKRLRKLLPGETEGKLWMWSCCGKCKHDERVQKCSKRVLISAAARRLSFGKFLELSFSHDSSFGRLSSCGHSLDRDFLYFFGLGPMAAMLKYSPVTTYTVSLPPQKLEFSHSIRHDGLKQEFEEVYTKGRLLFDGIADALKKLRSKYEGATLNLGGSLKEFSDIENMLKEESSKFEASIINAVAKNGYAGQAYYKFLNLNRLLWELLLESSIWERRLHSLLLPDPSLVGTVAKEKSVHDQLKSNEERNEGTELVSGINCGDLTEKLSNPLAANEFSTKEIPVDVARQESRVQNHLDHSSSFAEDIKRSNMDHLSQNKLPGPDLLTKPNDSGHHYSSDSSFEAKNIALYGDLDVERTIPIGPFFGNDDSVIDADASKKGTSLHSIVSSLENSNGWWFWMPFSDIRQIYMEDLERGFMPKFQTISSYMQEHVSPAYQLISEEGQRLHIPLGTNNYIVRDYDGELSSIIACALAVLRDIPVFNEDAQKKGGLSAKSSEGLHFLTRVPTRISSHWSSNGSSDSDSLLSVSPEESRFSSFDGLSLLESLAPPENESREVSFGVSKLLAKGKYSVICVYENQFSELRRRCCPSEEDYIASLSRCKNWDAKGGKSKSFFAKTLDERFIIKEIKKTEFESFVKFAPHYFKYMNQSFELGNQTCLAKVLGIYQVIIRQTKSGKEMRHDLMVMENLSFGRNITRQYDLKGALHARYSSAADGSGDVLLDQNFVNDMNSSPLYVNNKAKRLLERAVWNDTTFLNSINVMDYSLLVGVDTHCRELVCGIIDYLRQYTWDKQLETWVKSSLVVPKNVLPTVISPKEYKKRFRKFMAEHFLSVPNNWCTQRSSDPCELCGIRNDSKSPKGE